MTVSEAVVKRVFELCDERHITINKISTISGVTQSTISDIVNRRTKAARVDTIKKLCDGLEITMRQFFDSPLFDDLEQEIK
ncbi:MAG: helix-turn-helix domain-containing protein [bacterium]